MFIKNRFYLQFLTKKIAQFLDNSIFPKNRCIKTQQRMFVITEKGEMDKRKTIIKKLVKQKTAKREVVPVGNRKKEEQHIFHLVVRFFG